MCGCLAQARAGMRACHILITLFLNSDKLLVAVDIVRILKRITYIYVFVCVISSSYLL